MAEQKRRRGRRGRFLPGFLLYLLFLGLLLGAVLFVFRDFLTIFEATRPERALEQVRSEFAEHRFGESCREAISTLDLPLQSEDEAMAAVSALLEDARLAEDVSQNSEERRVYRIIADGVECGRLALRQQEALAYGFAPWAAEELHFDFSPWVYSLSVTVPEDYTVYCGDTALDRSYVTGAGIRYAALGECYDYLDDLPAMVRYEAGPLLGETSLRVFDTAGRELSPGEQNEERYLDNCSPEQKERIQAFAEQFVPCYVHFTAYKADYHQLNSLLAPGSAAARRLEQAVGEKWWSRAGYCHLLSSRVNRCVDLGEGRLLLDLSYQTETKIAEDPVTDTYSMRLVLIEQNGALQAVHMFNY